MSMLRYFFYFFSLHSRLFFIVDEKVSSAMVVDFILPVVCHMSVRPSIHCFSKSTKRRENKRNNDKSNTAILTLVYCSKKTNYNTSNTVPIGRHRRAAIQRQSYSSLPILPQTKCREPTPSLQTIPKAPNQRLVLLRKPPRRFLSSLTAAKARRHRNTP